VNVLQIAKGAVIEYFKPLVALWRWLRRLGGKANG
jgi:hypothetical protein